MAIGGYFELELPKGKEWYEEALRLNTGRNALEYILRARAYRKVYLPAYTCDVILEPIEKLNLEVAYYNIDEDFKPVFDFSSLGPEEVFVYNNYFGLCDARVKEVTTKTDNLITDNSQAFYSPPLRSVDTFYSPRKFFGLPDGAYLFCRETLAEDLEQDHSLDRFENLLGRLDGKAEEFFLEYKKNSAALVGQPIKRMSCITQRLLEAIPYEVIAEKRRENFSFVHEHLKELNALNLEMENSAVPLVYPFLIDKGAKVKEHLINKKIFVPTYWPNKKIPGKFISAFEKRLQQDLIAIPIDQRYGKKEMKLILDELQRVL